MVGIFWDYENVRVPGNNGADLTEEQKQQLSMSAPYIRITDKGRFRLHPDWTPSA